MNFKSVLVVILWCTGENNLRKETSIDTFRFDVDMNVTAGRYDLIVLHANESVAGTFHVELVATAAQAYDVEVIVLGKLHVHVSVNYVYVYLYSICTCICTCILHVRSYMYRPDS